MDKWNDKRYVLETKKNLEDYTGFLHKCFVFDRTFMTMVGEYLNKRVSLWVWLTPRSFSVKPTPCDEKSKRLAIEIQCRASALTQTTDTYCTIELTFCRVTLNLLHSSNIDHYSSHLWKTIQFSQSLCNLLSFPLIPKGIFCHLKKYIHVYQINSHLNSLHREWDVRPGLIHIILWIWRELRRVEIGTSAPFSL